MQFFSDFYSFVYSHTWDLMQIVIPSVFTFFVTRFSIYSPRKIELKQKQLDLVYLPLYKIVLRLKSTHNLSDEKVLCYCKQMIKILQKNYVYAFPQLHKLCKQLLTSLEQKEDYNLLLSDIIYQIEFDYERLTRALGYPTNSLFDIWQRIKPKDKILFIISVLLTIIMSFIGACMIVAILDQNLRFLIFNLALFTLCCMAAQFLKSK